MDVPPESRTGARRSYIRLKVSTHISSRWAAERQIPQCFECAGGETTALPHEEEVLMANAPDGGLCSHRHIARLRLSDSLNMMNGL